MTIEVVRRAELERERATLAKADQDIVDGEKRVGKQQDLVDALRARGQDAGPAEHLLNTLFDTLAAWKRHRDLIRERIATLEEPAR